MTSTGSFGEPIPLTSAQREVWFAQELLGDVAMTTTQYVDIVGPLDRDAYVQAGRRAAREFGVYLRFARGADGQIRQWIDYAQDDEVGYLDLRGEQDPRAAALDWMRADQRLPFDLLAEPPLRSTILHIGDDRHLVYSRAHHIALDGYGAMRLQERHTAVYVALVRGAEIPDGPECTPAMLLDADLAYRQSSRYEIDRAHWADTMAGLPEPVSMALRTGAPDAQAHVVGADVAVAGSDLIVAALAIYLARMTGTTEVVLALPVTARTTAALRRSAGMVSNVVPLRIAVGDDATVGDVVAATRRELSGALRHQRFRGEEMLREAHRPQSSGFGPAVNIMNFCTGMQLGDAVGTLNLLSTGPVEDLAVNIYPATHGALRLEIEGNPNRYSRAELVAHHRRFARLLGESMAAESGTGVHTLAILDDAERERLVPWLGAEAVEQLTLADVIASAVARNPSGDAVVYGERRWTYAEFDAWTNRLARTLIEAGAGPETLVATALERSADSVAAVWAITKAGAAFVPIDPGYPAERIEHILADSGAQLGVTTSALHGALPGSSTWLTIDDPATAAGRSSAAITDADRNLPLTTAHPVYLIYTSGSTGVPKGVLVTHGGLANLAADRRDRYDLHPGSVTLHHASPGFDMAVGEQLCALAGAAPLVVAPRDIAAGPDLADLIRRERVSNAIITPAVLATLDPAELPSLRVLGVGGEAIRADLVDAWAPGRLMRNGYGPTEATDIATIGELVAGLPVTIGAPVRGFSAVVLDRRLRPVPPDVPGELYIGGPALARGYQGKSALSSTRFVADPFGAEGGRLYRTGDLVSITAGARPALNYHGRTDFQVKVRGHRIEPSEVETMLTARPDIARAAVTAHTDPLTGTHLVAYLVPANGASVDLKTLRREVAAALPSYLRPAAYTVLETLPLTSNGKLDRRRLPSPVFESRQFRAPSTPAEHTVAAVYGDVLGATSVSANADFFALGGTSLTATHVAARLGVSVRDVFDAPTVAELATRIPAIADASRPIPVGGTRPDRIPLAPAQLLMWMVNQLHPESSAYHLPAALRIRGELDVVAAAAAATAVIGRHEISRTVYPELDYAPYQRILTTAEAAGRLHLDPVEVTPDRLSAKIDELTTAPFDVTVDLPIRMHLLRVARDEHVLVLIAHHIAMDGWSFGPLITDLCTAYAAFAAGVQPQWRPLPVQYADYALWQHDVLGDPGDPHSIAARQLAHWTRTLDGSPDQLPLHANQADDDGIGGTVDFEIDAHIRSGLIDLASSNGATVFMVTYAAYVILLHELSGSTDVTVGTPLAGRGHPSLQHSVGMFVNTLPLRVQIDPVASGVALIARTRAVALAAFDNADVPLSRVVEAVKASRPGLGDALFRSVFSYENLPPLPRMQLAGLEIDRLDVPERGTQFELALTLREEPGSDGLVANFRYATALFPRASVDDFAERYRRILQHLVADPQACIAELAGGSVASPRPRVAERSARAGRTDNRPRTPAEQAVADAFTEVLGIDSVGLDDSFFDLGGTSLSVFTLRSALARRLGRDIEVRTLIRQPTVRALAAPVTDTDGAEHFADRIASDARLDASFAIAEGTAPPDDFGAILLTGATGFLGVHLLRELLDDTDSQIHCLVRAGDIGEGLRRIVDGLRQFRLPDADVPDRVRIVLGDLAAPRLGLSSADFTGLAGRIGVIYHNGARVNHVESYQDLRAANVGGTTEVLRLAITGRIKSVHFVSTLNAVLGENHSGVVLEDSTIAAAEVPRHGYIGTKWVAEQLVLEAGERGVPVAIYRPGLICGASDTGIVPGEDSMWTMVRAAALLGVAPDVGDAVVTLVPVDYVARALVALGARGRPNGERYHLVNTQPIRVAHILSRLTSMGYHIRTVGAEAAKDVLAERASTNEDLMRAALLAGNFTGDNDAADTILDDTNTRIALAATDIRCPHVDDEMIDRSLANFRQDGLLPQHARS